MVILTMGNGKTSENKAETHKQMTSGNRCNGFVPEAARVHLRPAHEIPP